MTDMYPGSNPGGPERPNFGRADEFVYRSIAELLKLHRLENGLDPNSVLGQNVDARLGAMKSKGLDEARLSTVSSLAHINHQRDAELEADESLKELAALMEEPPGA